MSDTSLEHIVLVFFVWSYKLAAMLIGYLFARLGRTLFLKGVAGEFKFSAEIRGIKADLASASPGLFLILMGTIIVGVTLYRGFSVDFSPAAYSRPSAEAGKSPPPRMELPKSQLPSHPPALEPQAPPQEKAHERK